MTALWEPYKAGSLTGLTSDSSGIQRQRPCGPEQTFDLAYQNRRSSGTIERPRRVSARRGRATLQRLLRKAATP